MKEATSPSIDFMIVNLIALNLREIWKINFPSLTSFSFVLLVIPRTSRW